MHIRSARPRRLLWGRPGRIAFVALVAALALLPLAEANAGGYTTINGSGSSWASIALFQWAKDVQPKGLTVNYNPSGSAPGRADFIQGSLVDFAGSDPPFRNGQDKLGQTGAEHPQWGYSYVPDTAGGTAFMYHITERGHLVRNLRLSGQVLMEIFTGQIKKWNDPADHQGSTAGRCRTSRSPRSCVRTARERRTSSPAGWRTSSRPSGTPSARR